MTEKIPDGDVLIHAGDCTNIGRRQELEDFIEWFRKLPHKYKILIVGNHDKCFDLKFTNRNIYDRNPVEFNQEIWTQEIMSRYLRNKNHHLLKEESCIIEGKTFWGSPASPWFHGDYWAFNYHRGEEILSIWEKIPEYTDVLITHGPPYGRLDRTQEDNNVGCEALLRKILDVKPKVHIFGHIHEAYGIVANDYTTFINPSICTRAYVPSQKPIVWEI
jgi:Icc-related predicted phosphoesterase